MTKPFDQNHHVREEEFADELPAGTELLRGQYVIEEYLNSGGFGITYLAKDSLHRRVVVKECFPTAFCRRNDEVVGVRSRAHAGEFRSIVSLFVQEARNLARLTHPNIVGVHQVFEDNDTAYMALDYVEGRDLLDIIFDPKTTLSPEQVEALLRKILGAVEFIHGEGVLHRDISPDNILVTAGLEPVLIDFGAARETASKTSRILTALRVVKDGYSPQEFYLTGNDQYPCSDLYALAASIYHLITGTPPPNAQQRLSAVAGREPDPYVPAAARARGYRRSFLAAIDKALNLFPKDRLQTATDWLAYLDNAPDAKPVPEVETDASPVDPVLAAQVQEIVAQTKPKNTRPQRANAERSKRPQFQPDETSDLVRVATAAPKRPSRAKTTRPTRDRVRIELPELEPIAEQEAPSISLEEAFAERRAARSFSNRVVAALLVTFAVIWFQYGDWMERSQDKTLVLPSFGQILNLGAQPAVSTVVGREATQQGEADT